MITVLSMKAAMERHHEFDAVLTIENADRNLQVLRVEDGRPQLALAFNDIDFDDGSALMVTKDHVRAAIAFGREVMAGARTLLIHCHAGRCRSPAIAMAIVADYLQLGEEELAVDHVLQLVPNAAPNLHVLKLADEVLEREGRLQAAWMDRYERGKDIVRVRRLKAAILARRKREEGQ